ncbi:unannotated protein [freshwater metagenome]|uniref:Unannotated protein n=1 Tax=freshwater metagenome TaxID=449393 RepID=A0A6J6EZP5_9ZZZZ
MVTAFVLRVLLEAVPQGGVATHHDGGHRLGQTVADRIRMPEHPGGVPHGVAGLDGAERDDLGHVFATVGVGRVADHLVAIAGVEVHVDVGHGDSTGIEEAFEQQVVADGVDLGDSEAIGHRATGRRTASGPDPDVATAGVTNEIPDDEEVRRETHVGDDLGLVGETLDDGGIERVAPTAPGPLAGEVLEVGGVVVESLGHGEVGKLGFAELDRDVGPLGDPERVVTRLGHLTEDVAHLLRRLQVVLGAVESETFRVVLEGVGLHAQQRVMAVGVVTVRVVRIVGGQQRRPEILGDAHQKGIRALLRRNAVVLQFDEQVVLAEDLLKTSRLGEGVVVVVAQEGLQNVTTETTGGGDEALVMTFEKLPVHAGLVVVPLEERQAGQLDEVLVAGVVLGEQREVVVELPPAFGLASGVVHQSTPCRAFETGLVRQVGLGADDGFDPVRPTFLVEVEHAVHVSVVGHAEGRLSVLDRLGHQLVELRGAVEHRELGVNMQVRERIRHVVPPP